MAQINMANVTSLEQFLNRRVLFVHGFPPGTAMSNMRETLMRVCPPAMGRVDILTHADGTTRGTAFCNFTSTHDAAAALEEFRFSLYYPSNSNNLLKVFYSSDRQFKVRLFGAAACKRLPHHACGAPPTHPGTSAAAADTLLRHTALVRSRDAC